MFKLLIVDDEYYFRQALKVSLPWEELGFRVAGEAKNGEEALALMAEIEPDVVLVDLNMPIMDGMELMQNARQGGFATKFIVLTGHSEFAYAKQAMQLGVFNYVLKPIDENEIRSSLLELKELILKELSVKLELENLKQQALENIPLLKDRLLNEWLQGAGVKDPSSEAERLSYLGIDLNAPVYRVAIVDLDEKDVPSSEEEKQIRKLAVRDIAQEFMRSSYPYAGCHDRDDRYTMIVGCPDDSYDRLEPLLAAIRKTVHSTLGSTVTIGVGQGYPGFEAITVSYKEAAFALKHRLVLGGNQVISYSTIAESGMKGSLFSVEKRSALLMCMRIGNRSETEEWVAAFFRHARDRIVAMEMLLVAGLEIASTCLEFLAEMSLGFEDVYRNDGHSDILNQVQRMNSCDQLESWARDLVLRVTAHVHGNKKTRAIEVVEDVKAYIERFYGNEELRIEDIARSVHLNYNHLCYVFKKETTVTINDYLTEVRMAKAKELFDRGEKVVQAIASRVGYADANYFGKCFKKYTGITPSQYVRNFR